MKINLDGNAKTLSSNGTRLYFHMEGVDLSLSRGDMQSYEPSILTFLLAGI